MERGRAVRAAPGGHTVFLPGKRHGIDHARQVRVDEKYGFTQGTESETQGGFGEIHKTRRPDDRAVRDAEFIRARLVAQPAARQIDRAGAVIVQLHVVHIRQVRVG